MHGSQIELEAREEDDAYVPVPGGTSLSGNLPCSSDHGTPTSVAFTSTDPAHIVASSRSGDTILYDLEAGSALLTLESRGSSGKGALGRGSAFLHVLLWPW